MRHNSHPPALHRQDGKTIIVTGASAGLGYFASEQLAAAGATVVMAARDEARGRAALEAVRSTVHGADVRFQQLDLASLDSVRQAAEELADLGRIDALLANAGVIGSQALHFTTDGFELQFGTNHLGHFALIARLMPALTRSHSRVVHVGSISHRWVRPDFRRAAVPAKYSSYRSYALSKLAVMSFGFELAHRLEAAGSPASSVVAHPGYARRYFTPDRPGLQLSQPATRWQRLLFGLVAQGKDAGAWPLAQATAVDDVRNGDYWGPDGRFQLAGSPAVVTPERHARERNAASRLIDLSEELTGVRLRL
ncbi:SDR family NAD(P)-dependent oxidoreductase [Arthrobacter sp.]|uniref:SDR family NAD(P)-dependent oxidoreductase n=1 Tax=Arthrobacter sp. TaxID=1667 RepID=UPI00339887DB